MIAKLNRFLISVSIVLSHLYGRLHRAGTNAGHLWFDLMLYHGMPSTVLWDVEREFADGYITVRVVEDGVHQLLHVNFRVTNRWPVRDGRHPGNAFLFAIRSQALRDGYPIVHSHWFTDTAIVRHRSVLNIQDIPQRAEGILERLGRSWAGRVVVADHSVDAELREDLMRGVVRRI